MKIDLQIGEDGWAIHWNDKFGSYSIPADSALDLAETILQEKSRICSALHKKYQGMINERLAKLEEANGEIKELQERLNSLGTKGY